VLGEEVGEVRVDGIGEALVAEAIYRENGAVGEEFALVAEEPVGAAAGVKGKFGDEGAGDFGGDVGEDVELVEAVKVGAD